VSLLRKLLLSIMILGATTSSVGAGTFASFNASTSNSATFATGTLVLSNQKSTNSACLSTGGGNTNTNANGACDQLFALTVQKPGDSAFVDLTLKNEGSLNGSALTAYASQDCAAANATGQSYNGTGDPCTNVQLYIQEYSSAANRTADTRTGGTCQYGGGTATSCAFSATKTLDNFDTTYPSTGVGALSMGTLNTGVSRYLRIYLTLPSTAGNTLQGRQATFGFTWAVAQ
jgi:predicted ribosomally synthesized peptide with SipW-like signal peptide